MSALILPHRHMRQPAGLVEVDYSNPLAAGLVSAYNMTAAPLRIGNQDATGRYNGRKSSAGRSPYTLHGYQNDGTNEAGLVYTGEGAAWEFGGTYTTKAYNQKHPNAWSGAVTFIIRVLLHSNTADQCVIGHFNDSVTPDYLYGCGIYITGGTLYGVGANNNSRVISATAPDTGKWVTLACVTNTTDGRLYIDGQLVASGTLAGALSSYVFAIGCAGHTAAGATSGAAFLDGLVGPALTFSRALSDAEIRALSENPYQILQAANAPLWLDVVAGGGGVTGTILATEAQDAATLTGSYGPTGSLSATDSADSASFSGSASAPGISGTLSATEPADSATFAGALIFSGSLVVSESPDVAALAGAYGPTGTFSATDQPDAASFIGGFGSGVFGSLAAVDAADVAAFSGAYGPAGSLAAVDPQDVAVFSGTVPTNTTGSISATDTQDSAYFTGSGGVISRNYGGGGQLTHEYVQAQWDLLELRLRNVKPAKGVIKSQKSPDARRKPATDPADIAPATIAADNAPEVIPVVDSAPLSLSMPQARQGPSFPVVPRSTIPVAIPAKTRVDSVPNSASVVADNDQAEATWSDEDDESALIAILEVI